MLTVFKGTPCQIGIDYGRRFETNIRTNLDILVWRKGYEPLPLENKDFIEWVKIQEKLVGKNWPWLLEEMAGVAEGAGVKYEDILLLNLRAWQFEYYGAKPMIGGCSSLAITLADGTVVCTGTLDYDSINYYCGPVRIVPDYGNTYISFPITGTSWCNRFMNNQGLSFSSSSQVIPGLWKAENTINQDLAQRAIAQTCSTVDDVREFCKAYPFTLNIVAVDAYSNVFCAQHTAAGLFEMPVADGYVALTNHVADDAMRYWLQTLGVEELPESPVSRFRRGNLLSFAHEQNRKCTDHQVRRFMSKRNDNDRGSINCDGTRYMTFTNPQVDLRGFWFMQPNTGMTDFIRLEV